MKPIIALTTGDPQGVGPEICLKAAADPRVVAECRPLLIGDRAYLLSLAGELPGGTGGDCSAWPEVARSGFEGWGSKQGDDAGLHAWSDGPAFFDLADLPDLPLPGRPGAPPAPSAAGGRAAVMYVKQAVALVRQGAVAAMTTAPASKTAMRLAGHAFPGHTELLADLCGIERRDTAMLFVAGRLKVALLTIHQALRDAIGSLSRETVAARLRLLHDEHRRWFGAAPRIGLCALNPHAGEGGLFGAEEEEILAPAVREARAAGLDVSGPWPADTIWQRMDRGDIDLALALYHDQATIAVKSRAFGRAVNMTLGLPLLRTSVDHGTAYEIAGRGVADPSSLIEAVRLAARLTAGRAEGV